MSFSIRYHTSFSSIPEAAWKIILFSLATLPPAWIVWLIWHAGSLPDNDYWSYLSTILNHNGFTTRLDDWLSHGTEHIVLIPKLIYALNIRLSDGDNRILGAIAFIFAGMQVLLLYWLARRNLPREEWPLALLTISIFLFTPRAVHNWMMGMSGVAWIGANLCAVFALWMIWLRQPIGAYSVAALGLLAYSTALAVWPAMVVGTWLVRLPWRRILMTLAWTLAVIAFYIHQYHTPASHPALEKDPLVILQYSLIFIGGLISTDPTVAGWAGGIGILLSGFLFLLTWKIPDLRVAAAPWIMLQVYTLGNAAMAAIARSGFGLEQALASRYATLPALFWLGLVFTAWVHLRRSISAKALRLGVLLVVTGLGIASWRASTAETDYLMKRSALKPLAMVSLYTEGFDYPLLSRSVTPVIQSPAQRGEMEAFGELLKIHRHVPFDDTFPACPAMGERLQTTAGADTTMQLTGFFDQARRIFPQTIKVHGWAYDGEMEITCIAITNQDHLVRGIAIGGFSRPDVARALQIDTTDTGWTGYVRPQPGDLWLAAWARVGDSWYPLQHTHPLPRLAADHSTTEVTHPE